MSAETVGRHMPPVITLDDLTAMMAADEHHRYEISPEGVLSVRPPAGYAHAIIATRLISWLLSAGVPADHVAQTVGLRIPGKKGGVGGRIPDLIVWSKAQSEGVTMYRLDDGRYQARATVPLAWILSTAPSEHDLR